ncbi:UNVERIFIED_CONTAM: hypothetical protein FKN15_020374, partial [Acipenser sinensis]
IQFNNDPEHVVDNYNLSIEYFCSNPCVVGVEVLASSELKTAMHIFRKRWKHVKPFRITRTRTVQLRFPSVMVYREDFFIRHSIIVQSVMLRAWIVHSHNYNHSTGYRDGYQQAVNKTYSILKSLPPYQRPFKKHNKSLQWGAKLMWRLTENRINQCPHETDAVEMLSFPHACTGERYGVVKTFYSFNNSDFEKTRIQQVGDPRFTLSMWMYFLNSCQHASCAIVHHISPNNTYGTPLVLYTETGSGSSEMTLEFGKKVFEMVSERLSDWEGDHVLSSLVPSLQISSCCGYHRASYYLAVMYETGLRVPVNYLQGHVYGLVGAQGDESLALMHLGYKHIQGIDGYPLDYDLSYSYYINIGKQTLQDRWKVQETQAYVESVRLTDETALKFHTNENSDLYQFLNLQAKRGDLDSQVLCNLLLLLLM